MPLKVDWRFYNYIMIWFKDDLVSEGKILNPAIIQDELNDENVIADAFDPRVVERESEAVAQAAIESGVARIKEVI
jgi:malate dehydrogenase (oxaloacetate-decarboxylating)